MKRCWLFAALSLCALELVFLAHRLPTPLVQAVLFLLAVLPLYFYRSVCKETLWTRRSKALLLAYANAVQAVLFFSGFYFSDDALRHLHEGDAILRGVDVYALPPRDWPSWTPSVPLNWEHSHIGSVYFPFTQLMSTAGAFLSQASGYIFLFHGAAALLSSALVLLSRRPGLLSGFLLSPAFVFISAGRHEDLLGALSFLLAMQLLRRRPLAGRLRSGLAGALAGTLCFIKPDGILLAGFVALYRGRRVAAGALFSAFLFLGFSFLFLWHGPSTVLAFLANLRLFAQGYTGYNPLSVYAPSLWETPGRPALILAGVAYFLQSWFRGGRRRLAGFAAILLVSVLLRGVWHPWYFVWLAGFLLWRRSPGGLELMFALSLFYIPVADLRIGSGFHFEKFYVALGIWLILWALDKFLTVRKFRRL